MSQALLALQWAVGVALLLLAILSVTDWLRHRGRSRRHLALAVGSLAILGIREPLLAWSGGAWVVVTAASIVLFMVSAQAFVLFRNSLIPLRPRRLVASTGLVLAVTAAGVAVNLGSPTAPARGVGLDADVLLLLTWCAVVGGSIWTLWRVSGTLPRVQRARLRSLGAAFSGIIVAVLATVYATAVASRPALRLAVECVVLLSMPLLAVSLSPPAWLRRTWREREEVQYRQAMNDLLLYSPDEATLAQRVLEWAARLLGGGGAMIALDGQVLAARGIVPEQAECLHRELEVMAGTVAGPVTGSAGPMVRVPLSSQAGAGYLAVLGGPFTPLFGDEEVARLGQYAVSVTLALDRVHLVAGMRRNAELFDLAHDAVLTWDLESQAIRYWNKAAAELYGYSGDRALGRNPHRLLRTTYPIPLDRILRALHEHDHWEGELRQYTSDGRVLPISARWALRRDAGGAPVSVLEINRDISDEKRAAEELRAARDAAQQASSAKSEYLSRMSHELRTPLAAMLGFSDLLEMREPREDQLQAIEAIQLAGLHLLSLVNDVLDIARIEAGREVLTLRPLDVRSVLEECAALVAQAAIERRVSISVRVDGPAPVHVRADRRRLVQVLLNLLTNAIKYGSEGGHVVAAATAGERAVEIEVSDDGPGLSEGDQDRLFEPFERLGAEARGIPGTGLGLALARQLTIAMGGTMRVHSVAGRGAAFTVRLEIATAADEEPPVASTGRPVLRDAAAERIVLYVEDSLATVSLVESIVALRPNIRLLTTSLGGLALELAREHRPDLVLLDLHLPDMRGDEVIARLRQDPRTAAIPVVMYSADATEQQVERLLAAGAEAYLTKPARVAELLGTIDRVLAEQDEQRRDA